MLVSYSRIGPIKNKVEGASHNSLLINHEMFGPMFLSNIFLNYSPMQRDITQVF